MKLEEIGAHVIDDAGDQLVVGIDHDGDGTDSCREAIAASTRGLFKLDVTRALRKEDEADEVGAGLGPLPR